MVLFNRKIGFIANFWEFEKKCMHTWLCLSARAKDADDCDILCNKSNLYMRLSSTLILCTIIFTFLLPPCLPIILDCYAPCLVAGGSAAASTSPIKVVRMLPGPGTTGTTGTAATCSLVLFVTYFSIFFTLKKLLIWGISLFTFSRL